MKIAFLTEMGFEGKIPAHHSNMRTEFAWMLALNADHRYIRHYQEVKDYDHVFIIFPKGDVYLNAFAVRLSDKQNSVKDLLNSDFVDVLKSQNKKVHFVQEGPHWLWNDYEIHDQILYYNMISQCDSIFAHNEYDSHYYLGMYPGKKVSIMPSLMIEEFVNTIKSSKEDKVIIGGNFARWYGGFESYSVASIFDLPIWVQDSHAKRNQEPMMENLNHLPRMLWNDWMRSLSSFKYAVHLMPTIAAGTFSLNCAYFGIPCIGNEKVDTQRICHPMLSIDVADVEKARKLAKMLKEDKEFYNDCVSVAKINYKFHYSVKRWKEKLNSYLNESE